MKDLSAPRVVEFKGLEIFGIRQSMSLAQNTTVQLWQKFRVLAQASSIPVSQRYYSLQVYPSGLKFDQAAFTTSFQKWAGIEKPDVALPTEFESFQIPRGTYVVFDYEGGPAKAAECFRWIFAEWLPASGWNLDDRPHFEKLPPDYWEKRGMVNEEIWIPVSKTEQ